MVQLTSQMMIMDNKITFSNPLTAAQSPFGGRYSPTNLYRAAAAAADSRRYMPTASWKSNCFVDNFKFDPNANFFPTIDDSFLARAEALTKPESFYSSHFPSTFSNQTPVTRFESSNGINHSNHIGLSMTSPSSQDQLSSHHNPFYNHSTMNGMSVHQIAMHPHDLDIDPRELEGFAERFKQKRIKLGVTQADVGQQLSKLKMPGVGSLSQSTICRFESLTLSHNNMVALKPVLQAWLEFAEAEARSKKKEELNGHNNNDKKRKRTSIAAQEKRLLEGFFSVQPRPSGEKIAQIAEKLDLKKNVVRVWFCNQRQKQKRMKFASMQLG
ncbi:unnamed protein product [Didymodactylos carnosus]|uniref:POU domain protein n=1 Tax=Didymodactylos carnosus TaxID=1234261 RepID=A0A813ZPH3_9BILA|nr:unnamed protein product [Didymodactylos carnosus]CAF0901968.1 unnamed protein product [Didymodactylos carnosus]CAF3556623.1 unnamed protein product [Didymodactylos carnosus]CAF3684308.1 unnamed protein product [Didymodactylos carnosus]